MPNITKPANRFWSFTRQAIFRKSKILKSISHLCRKSCRRKIQNTIRQIRSPVSCPKRRGRSRNISAMSRAEDNSRKESGTTLNEDRLSGERNSPSEPSVAIMGITTLSSHEMPYTLIYEYTTKLPTAITL